VATSFVPETVHQFVTSYNGAVGGSAKLTKKTTVSGDYDVSRQPLYYLQPSFTEVFDLIFGEVVLYDQSERTISLRRTQTRGNAAISQTLTRRVTASAEIGIEESTTTDHLSDFSRRMIGGRLSYVLAKGLSLRAGYGVTEGRSTVATVDEQSSRLHTFDGGVDYNKALSFSRRTTLTFSTGTSMLDDGVQTHYLVTGRAQVVREIGRTWNVNAGYDRGVSYVDVIRDPVLSHTGTVGVAGLLSRHTQFTAALGLSSGAAGFAVSNNNYTTLYGSVNLQYALTRTLALGVMYARYRYTFEDGVVLTPGVPSKSDRQMLRASLEMWQALFHRARRSNASR